MTYEKYDFYIYRAFANQVKFEITVEPVYSGHLQFLENLSAIARCPLQRFGFFQRKDTHKCKSDYRLMSIFGTQI